MEPNNFEKHIKKQLENREIQPSSESWQKVVDRLDITPRAKSNRFFWYGIAASFAGLLVIYLVYLGSQRPVVNSDMEIVDTDKDTIKVENAIIKATDKKTFQKEHQMVGTDQNPNAEELREEPIHSLKEKRIIEEDTLEDMVTIIASSGTMGDAEINDGDLDKDSEAIINAKIAEVMAQVDVLEQTNRTVSDAEVDSLLYKAQREIIAEKLFLENGKVDAMALLMEVEDELDQSFRDQIFEKLKTGFVRVRTAVADRNN
ncbi:hypothetical protein [Ulvibacterium sp.]|uniref:hypothetical protein n=1 Tax=Ulvibacterium sp. TaxID=2665914 RepID=UPI0026248156|nr:hypothetical protein [Ulvibacterium sp.]